MTDRATITIDGKSHDFPVITGSEGERGIDIAQLRKLTGCITLDPGLSNTGACLSEITYIDGEQGILRYRGIPIEQFTEAPNFIEVAWLLIFGKLPTGEEYHGFSERLTRNAHIHEGMRHVYQAFPPSSPPMACLSAMFNVLSCYHHNYLSLDDDEQFSEAAARLISKVRTIAAYIYRFKTGLPIIYPDPQLTYCSNLLHMMFSWPGHPAILDDDVRRAMNLIFILHADHEQNCSTSTVRVVGSSQANLFTSVAAGVSALWGPLHGGANVAVMEMLDAIHQGGLRPEDCIERAKSKTDPFRLMGFGHRVYKNYDPRAKVVQQLAHEVFEVTGKNPLLDIAVELERIALEDEYFVDRKLYPNVDFYSGIIYQAMGFPTAMFPVLFAMGRIPGWLAHWQENVLDKEQAIVRPRQIYTGPGERDYVPLSER